MKINYLCFSLIMILLFSCGEDDGGDSGASNPADVAKLMNENLILPAGSFEVDPSSVSIDDSIIINDSGGNSIPLNSGQQMTNQISFNAPNGNVNAVGMRFGTTGPIYFVPINTGGATAGTGNFQFALQAGICDDLSSICHDIKCYEFAQTSAGAISRGNIRDVAMLCGNCDEPSCQGLVDASDCGGLSGADGNPRFNLTWSGSTDLDLVVTDPNGASISFLSPSSNSGGTLDVDCVGDCLNGNSENITWPNTGPKGVYSFYVNYYVGNSTTSFSVVVRDNGNTVLTKTGTLASGDSATWSYTKN